MKKGFIIAMITFMHFGCEKSECASFPFEKIIFHFLPGYSAYEDQISFHFEVTGNSQARLIMDVALDSAGNTDTTKTGYFSGQLADSSMDRIRNLVSGMSIDALESEKTDSNVIITDTRFSDYIFYYDQKRKELHYRTMIPGSLNELDNYLFHLAKYNNLPRSGVPFDIEK